MNWHKTKNGEEYVDLSKAKRIKIKDNKTSFDIVAEFSLKDNKDVIIGTYNSLIEAQSSLTELIDELNGFIIEEDDSEEDS